MQNICPLSVALRASVNALVAHRTHMIQAPKRSFNDALCPYKCRMDYHPTNLPTKPRGVARVDDRRVLNGLFRILRSGAAWRDLPATYGPYKTCYNRFVRWQRAGVWSGILDAISNEKNADVQMIDSSIVRVHQHGSCIKRDEAHCTGRSRGGLTTKIHAVVDGRGLPVQLALSPGQEHDSLIAVELLSNLQSQGLLLADKAYDSDAIRKFVQDSGAWEIIPPRSNRKNPICFSPHLYRDRNHVERFFKRIERCRGIATRYEKLVENFPAFIKLAAIRLC